MTIEQILLAVALFGVIIMIIAIEKQAKIIKHLERDNECLMLLNVKLGEEIPAAKFYALVKQAKKETYDE